MTAKIKAILLKRPMSTLTRANLLIYGLSFTKKVTGSFCCTGWLNKRCCIVTASSIKQFSRKRNEHVTD